MSLIDKAREIFPNKQEAKEKIPPITSQKVKKVLKESGFENIEDNRQTDN